MIIPIYRVITTQYPIASTTTIEAGMVVQLNSTTGYVEKAAGNENGGAPRPLGFAADRNRASEAYEWVNRLPDSGNDTRASGYMTVYNGVGAEFYVDVDDSAITTPDGTAITGVVASAATKTVNTKLYANNGQLVSSPVHGSDTVCAIITAAAAAIDSGIPGEYEPGSSVAYADDSVSRTWVKIKSLI